MASERSDYPVGQDHVARYRATAGEEGYIWRRGATVLLLTTTGRRSGSPRTTPLIHREVDGAYVVIASNDARPHNPGWYLNLQADPDVEVQVKDDVFRARAREAEGEDRERLWDLMLEVWPDYESYQEQTDRRLPVVVLERKD